jgi:hypothetical protein
VSFSEWGSWRSAQSYEIFIDTFFSFLQKEKPLTPKIFESWWPGKHFTLLTGLATHISLMPKCIYGIDRRQFLSFPANDYFLLCFTDAK